MLSRKYVLSLACILVSFSYFLTAGALSPVVAQAISTPKAIVGTLTPIKSSIAGIISNRHQEHAWVTSDNAVHVFTAGSKRSRAGLTLFSSYDDGLSWIKIGTVAQTETTPKADGYLIDDTLYVVFNNSVEQLQLFVLDYNAVARSWSKQSGTTLYRRRNHIAERATTTIDSQGRVWFTFTEVDQQTAESTIRIGYLAANSVVVDAGKILGTRNTSSRKSARLLSLSDGLGIVYTDGPVSTSAAYTLNWAYRFNSWPTGEWIEDTIHFYTEADGATDASGAHFDAVVDSLDNVHIVTRSEGKLYYFNVSPLRLTQPDPQILADARPYQQVSVAGDDTLYISYPAVDPLIPDLVGVLRSIDNGQSFSLMHTLTYDPAQNLGQARLTMPAHITSFLPVLRQIEYPDGLVGLVYFHVRTGVP